MEKLLRSQYWTVSLVMAFCLGLMVLVAPRLPDRICSFPLWALIFGEYLFTAIVLTCAEFQSLRQSLFNLRLVPGLISIGLVFLAGAIGIVVSPITELGAGGIISIGLIQLTIMNFGILFCVVALTRIQVADLPGEKESGEGAEASAGGATKINRLTKIRMRAMEGKKTQEGPAEVTAEHLITEHISSIQPVQQSIKSATSQLTSQPTAPPAQKPASLSAQQLVQQLQKTASRKTADSSTAEKPAIAGSSEIDLKQKLPAKELPPEIRRLPSVHPTKAHSKILDPSKPASSAMSKLQALSASGTGAASHFQMGNIMPGPDQSGLRSVLDRLDNADEAAGSPDIQQGEKQIEQIGTPAKEDTLFKRPVDKEMDNIFAKLAPEQAQREIGGTASSSIQRMVETPPEVMPIPGQQTVDASGGTPLFKQSIDQEMDNIFAKLAPEQAQREVGGEASSTAQSSLETPAQEMPIPGQQAVDTSGGTPLFKQSVDEEMDNIFTKLAPAEAHKEVVSIASDTETQAHLFKEKVDRQVDEIFSGIAPAQAQKEVKDRSNTAEAKKASTADEITGERRTVSSTFSDSETSEQRSNVPELKDFGRLSAKASAEPEAATQAGTMKTIGKLLIDAQSVQNIIKKAESGKITVNLPSARVISLIRGQGIQNLLESIDSCHGVQGSMLVGGDGLVISSTFATAGDRDGTGVLAHGVLANSNFCTLRLDLGKLEQMVLITKTNESNNAKQVTTVFTDVEVGMLAVFLDTKLLTGLEQFLEKIRRIAHG